MRERRSTRGCARANDEVIQSVQLEDKQQCQLLPAAHPLGCDGRRVPSEPGGDLGNLARNGREIGERGLWILAVPSRIRLIALQIDPQGRAAGPSAGQTIDDA